MHRKLAVVLVGALVAALALAGATAASADPGAAPANRGWSTQRPGELPSGPN